MERIAKGFAIILFIVSIVLIGVSISGFKSMVEFKKIAEPITGVISFIGTYYDSDDEKSHNAYIDYEYSGEKYEHVYINAYNSSMHVGKSIKVYVNTINPAEVRYLSYASVILPIAMAIIFTLFGMAIFWGNKR